jgi:hypothetical protein
MSIAVRRLGPEDRGALNALLAPEPVHHMLLLGLLEEFNIPPAASQLPAFYGLFRQAELTAAVWFGEDGLVIPSLCVPADASALGEELIGKGTFRSCIGAASAIEAFVDRLGNRKPKLARKHRICFASADQLGPFVTLALRRAHQSDLRRLIPLATASFEEIFEEDAAPAEVEAVATERLRAGKTYVLEIGEQLVLKVEVAARSHYGAELEGLFTDPQERFRGHATMALGQISRELLSSLPRLTMRVDERADGLMTVARKVGYSGHPVPQLLLAY